MLSGHGFVTDSCAKDFWWPHVSSSADHILVGGREAVAEQGGWHQAARQFGSSLLSQAAAGDRLLPRESLTWKSQIPCRNISTWYLDPVLSDLLIADDSAWPRCLAVSFSQSERQAYDQTFRYFHHGGNSAKISTLKLAIFVSINVFSEQECV